MIYFNLQLHKSETEAEKFASRCKSRRHLVQHFIRFDPLLKEMISIGETSDEKLIDMLMETKCYMARDDSIERMEQLISFFKQLSSST